MTEQRNKLAALFAACWKDEALKARFMSDPKAVLAEYGMDVPDGIDVNVVENSDNTVHITMPQAPAGAGDLSDEDLASAAGGSVANTGQPDTECQVTPCRLPAL
ncbi:MAG: NHLP leader peptide family RiPP precursor [Planctomycetota bacterium]|nr:NHLP leader peptide family RiPP precursor [Planctomycetota bacterium]